MENGDALYARIAELEEENEKLKKDKEYLRDLVNTFLLAELEKEREEDTEDEDEDSDEEGCLNCYYICRHCFAFGTEDPDCTRCGRKRCVLLYQERNAFMALRSMAFRSMAIQAATDLLAIQAANEVDLIGHNE